MSILKKFLVTGAAMALTTSAFAHIEDNDKIEPSDGMPDDAFGFSVSIDFHNTVIGAPGHDSLAADAGAAYTYAFEVDHWHDEVKLLASNGAAGDAFGSAVAIDGDTILVGAPNAGAGGAAYVFRFDGLNWIEEAILIPAGLPALALLGHAVALDGDTAVVGARDASTAYVFTRSGSIWSEQQALVPSVLKVGDEFGASVAVSGNTIAVGAPVADSGALSAGAIHTYSRAGAVWTQNARLTHNGPVTGDRYGHSVHLFPAAAGMELTVGAPGRDDSGLDAGETRVFRRVGAAWALMLDKDGFGAGDGNGTSVARAYRATLSGCPFDDDEADNGGTAFRYMEVFGVAPTLEIPVASDNEMDDNLGFSASADFPFTILGAPGHDAGAGGAYIHSLVQASTTPINGSGSNPQVLTSLADPVVGEPWDLTVDVTAFPTSERTILVLRVLPANPPVVFNLGELLIAPQARDIIVSRSDDTTHSLLIPNNPQLAGLSATVQAFINGPAPTHQLLALGDAITMVLGSSNLPLNSGHHTP